MDLHRRSIKVVAELRVGRIRGQRRRSSRDRDRHAQDSPPNESRRHLSVRKRGSAIHSMASDSKFPAARNAAPAIVQPATR